MRRRRDEFGSAEETATLLDMTTDEDRRVPSADTLLSRGGVVRSGTLLKKHDPLKGLLLDWRLCGLCSVSWRPRLVIISGRYLFRYADESAAAPKGTPVSLDGARAGVEQDEDGEFVMTVSTVRHQYEFRSESGSEAELREWAAAIAQVRQRAIKEDMRHAQPDAAASEANAAGRYLSQQREARREDGREGLLEMTALG